MSQGFEEFLKRERKSRDTNRLPMTLIDKDKLGEWAWQEWKEQFIDDGDYLIKWKDGNLFFKSNDGRRFTLLDSYREFEIAFACLGKKEVEKRLKELSEK